MNIRFDEQLRSNQDFQALLKRTSDYSARLRSVVTSGEYQEYESSILLPSDQQLLEQVQALAKEKAGGNLRHHIVVGIGGSTRWASLPHGRRDAVLPSKKPVITRQPKTTVRSALVL